MTKRIVEWVPSVSPWRRGEFLDARKRQMAAAYQAAGPEDIIVDAGDEIVCDSCNANADGPIIFVVDYGSAVACPHCLRRWHSGPIKYRPMYEDGSLGKEEENVCNPL